MKKLIFYHHSVSPKIIEQAKKVSEIGEIKWEKFPDTWPHPFIKQAEQIEDRDVVFIANLAKPETLFEQLAVIYALPMHLARTFNIIIPFYPVGTMERVSVYGEIATAKSFARMLSATPMSPIITIIDIHAQPGQFYFDDNRIRPKLVSAMPLLKERIKRIMGLHFTTIAFPDDGAHKRFGKMFPEYPHIICNKVRMSNGKKVVTIKEGKPKGRHVIIVDDLIQTGGTLIECRNALIKAGASAVSAYATHGVFPENSWKNFGDLFGSVWITDSCPDTVKKIKSNRHFETLSLAPLIAKLL